MTPPTTIDAEAASALATLEGLCRTHGPALTLADLVRAGVDRLPLPGGGRTLLRWQVLAAVAAHDLSLVKLFEGHTDALAILAELHAPPAPPAARWGTWCAEPPNARLTLAPSHRGAAGELLLNGTKAWCSGAAQVTHAVVSCWNLAGEACLAAVAMDQPGIRVTHEGWHAVGMAASGSVDVHFDEAKAVQIGRPGDYVNRPGFWQGGAGIAACWFGGALGIARTVHRLGAGDAHRLAHLGAMDVSLGAAAAPLREAASFIDAHPRADARHLALRVRLAAEAAATEVMHHAGRAVGAAPLCKDAQFARAMADLPVYLRQSHAERDLAALGAWVVEQPAPPWQL